MQEEEGPVLRGQVRVGSGEADAASPGHVVLHRVSPDFSGEIDSVAVGPEGSFRFTLPEMPDHEGRSEVFFASIRYRGLLYFGPAITRPAQLDSLYVIQAYDTLSVPPGGADLPVTVRNVFLEKVEDGWVVTDVFQVRQGGERTLYSPEEGVVWSYPLPAGARNFQVGQGDLDPESVRLRDGTMQVLAPIPPGERFFMVRYALPADEFVIPLPGETGRAEVLVREPGPGAEVTPLVPAEPVELEPGNVFRRYAADGLRDTEIQVNLTSSGSGTFRAEWLGLLLAAVLAGAGVFAYRLRRGEDRPSPGERDLPSSRDPEGGSREDLLTAIARLDEEFSRVSEPSSRETTRYETQREKLLAQLKRLS
jgi:hypothetical protein